MIFIKIFLMLLEICLTWALISEGNTDTRMEIHAEPKFACP